MRVVILVTHLLGSGHLSRALTLARAFAHAGHETHVISGGRTVPTLDASSVNFHQLPPLASDGTNFTRLMTDAGAEADAPYQERRKNHLLELIKNISPEVLITELFPFGRRILREEFKAALQVAKSLDPQPKVFSSIRDILAPPSKPAKAEAAEALLVEFYTGVLVHSDEQTTPLSTSWPVTPVVQDKLHYTGFVAPPAPAAHPDMDGQDEVLVTAGGGSVGQTLFEAALQAAALGDHRWRLLIGGADRADRIEALQRQCMSDNVVIEAARPDFRQMLCHAAASVSMCGYNTAMDLLQTGCAGVLIPFDEGGEVEQTLRAESLVKTGQFAVIFARDLTPQTLANAVSERVRRGRQTSQAEFDGANQTVRIVERSV